jgi:hypothetical protein
LILRQIQAHLEAIYRIEAPDVTRFQIDASQLAEVTGDALRHADEWVLVRESEGVVDLAVFVADEHIQALEAAGGLSASAIEAFPAFCAAIEGVSHFLMLIERVRRSEPVKLLELEAQAEVDKFVSARLHHPDHSEAWQRRLFEDARLASGLDSAEIYRYQEAGRLAAGFCAALDEAPHVDSILRTLRSFWRDSGAKRLDTMRRLAA